MNLARPSSKGSSSELTMLTCRISEQQCCMEIDSVSKTPKGSDVARLRVLSPSMMNCFFSFFFSCTVLTSF